MTWAIGGSPQFARWLPLGSVKCNLWGQRYEKPGSVGANPTTAHYSFRPKYAAPSQSPTSNGRLRANGSDDFRGALMMYFLIGMVLLIAFGWCLIRAGDDVDEEHLD